WLFKYKIHKQKIIKKPKKQIITKKCSAVLPETYKNWRSTDNYIIPSIRLTTTMIKKSTRTL
ncbi:hypothetical protein, partial [Enterobacter intestinihominis]